MKWRESVGIEPTSPLAKTSAVLKTERDTSPVLSHDDVSPILQGFAARLILVRVALSHFGHL
jgi:hypothetical protein